MVIDLEFSVPSREDGSVFVEWVGGDIDDILCEQFDRVVSNDNNVSFNGLLLQIPKDEYRCHYVKAKVRVHQYVDGRMAMFHGPRKLAVYDNTGDLMEEHGVASAA